MVCKNCKKENIAGRRFCFFCGSPLEEEKPKRYVPIWVVIATACTIALAGLVVACVIFVPKILQSILPQNSVSSAASTSSSTSVTSANIENSAVASLASGTSSDFKNVGDRTGFLKDDQLKSLQQLLEQKSNAAGTKVYLMISSDYSGDIHRYADEICKRECGGNGIALVADSSGRKMGVSSSGNGSKLMPKALVAIIEKDSSDNLQTGNTVAFCEKTIKRIPENSDDASLYSFAQIPDSTQVIYANSGSGKLTLIDWSADIPKKQFETGTVYFGMDGITDDPSEYKSATPKGTFRLGFAFSTNTLDTKIDTVTITPGMVWVDDPDSNYYNTLQYGDTSNPPKWSSAENTYNHFASGINYACILIEHNGDGYTKGVSKKGSAMYLAGKNENLTTSYGDVNISASDMKNLLSYLDESKNPYIVIQ